MSFLGSLSKLSVNTEATSIAALSLSESLRSIFLTSKGRKSKFSTTILEIIEATLSFFDSMINNSSLTFFGSLSKLSTKTFATGITA